MSTQVILTAPVEKLGAEGDTVVVADGYARNMLIPRGLAIPATPANLRRTESLRQKRAEQEAAQLHEAKEAAEKLAKHTCTISRSAGPDRKLFGSVTAADISDALKTDGFEVDRKQIVLEHSIRELGVFEVDVKLHHDVSVKLKLRVEAGAETSAAAPTTAAKSAAPRTSKPPKKK